MVVLAAGPGGAATSVALPCPSLAMPPSVCVFALVCYLCRVRVPERAPLYGPPTSLDDCELRMVCSRMTSAVAICCCVALE